MPAHEWSEQGLAPSSDPLQVDNVSQALNDIVRSVEERGDRVDDMINRAVNAFGPG
jgi:hypothetical protein